jgi:glycerol-3-phosphate dehydrogenase (NAD(P)+)
MSSETVAVIGAGSYGTCLAKLFGDVGHRVTLWCRGADAAAQMQRDRTNATYLPGHRFAETITVTHDLDAAVRGARFVLGVTPSHGVRDVIGRAAAAMDPDAIVINASKGLEDGTLETIDAVYRSILPPRLAARATYLSGPTFAHEVAAGKPAAIVLAGRDPDTTAAAQQALSSARLRIYTTDDVLGVLVGGALKNVIAIAAGVSDGLDMGSNARAALITRGLAEITRMGVALGAHALTFAGLSGMGDLVLTCSGDASRNRRVGLALGHGKTMVEIMADMKGSVAEGVKTTKVAHALAGKLGVPAPITAVMNAVIHEGAPAIEAITSLMSRALKAERD